jgi:hypothetical protein
MTTCRRLELKKLTVYNERRHFIRKDTYGFKSGLWMSSCRSGSLWSLGCFRSCRKDIHLREEYFGLCEECCPRLLKKGEGEKEERRRISSRFTKKSCQRKISCAAEAIYNLHRFENITNVFFHSSILMLISLSGFFVLQFLVSGCRKKGILKLNYPLLNVNNLIFLYQRVVLISYQLASLPELHSSPCAHNPVKCKLP